MSLTSVLALGVVAAFVFIVIIAAIHVGNESEPGEY